MASCSGDNPAGTNLSPRTTIEVIGPGEAGTIFNSVSPAIRRDISGALAGYPALDPQPAPGNSNYRGGAHGSTVPGAPSAGNNTRAWTVNVNLEGRPAGIYTVRTVTTNMVRTGAGACTVGTPPQAATTTGFGNTVVAGPIVEEQSFEYRPWQHTFRDVFGGGKVNMNITPKEFQAAVANQVGSIADGSTSMRLFAVPSVAPGADPLPIMLPSDPAGCAADPTSCLPPASVECPEATAECVPRLVIVNRDVPRDRVQGVFDLQTKAFAALVNINNTSRVLLSLGTQSDAMYRDLLNKLAAAASAQGVDLLRLLATTVRVRNGNGELTLSLLNGLQLQPAPGQPAGIQIVSDMTVQAGLILNIYAALGGSDCAPGSAGDSDPTTAAPDRYTPVSDAGYTVEKSDLLPDVPRVGAVGALVGGPIYHIEGDFVGAAPPLANTSTAVIGLDTAADEPNGYPVWVEPFLSSPANTTVARTMDFIGTATWSASETSLGALGCLTVDFMLGAGVAIYNNPLDIGFGDIPIWDPQSPEVAALIDQIDAAVQGVVDGVTSNPTVAAVLEQITGSLPEVPGL